MKYIIALTIILLSVANGYSQQERKYIREGNKLYKKGLADSAKIDTVSLNNAEIAYRRALLKKPESFEANFNLGDALYKQKKYEEAANQFKALASKEKDKDKLAKVNHNLGNSLLQAGKYEESIDAYKNALKNKPKDMDTKYNLAYAQSMLKKQQQQKQQNKDNKDKKDQQKQQQQQQQKQEQKKDQQKQQQKQEQKISKEDAKRLLESLQNDEKQVQDKLKREKAKSSKVQIEKDW